jgi:hypothetical protein
MDYPIWYSTIAACPQYPFDDGSSNPAKVSPNFTWHRKLSMDDAAVKQCYKEMPGGNYCGGKDKKTGRPKGSPYKTPSKTCTWQAKSAGYLTIEDIFNIKGQKYHDWCMAQPDDITGYGSSENSTGIPSNISLFYNLSELSFPALQGLTPKVWHMAASTDSDELTSDQKNIFQNWAREAKIRLVAMFEEMDKQAFAKYNKQNLTDPENQTYTGCLTNKDLPPPACKNGVVPPARSNTKSFTV